MRRSSSSTGPSRRSSYGVCERRPDGAHQGAEAPALPAPGAGMLTAPPYRNEGPRALWHVSDDPSLGRFLPRDGKVWAIDTRHLPLYWFPRDCARATFWANEDTSDGDVERWLGGDRLRRVHVIESAWLARMCHASVFAYRMPEETFELEDRFWISA